MNTQTPIDPELLTQLRGIPTPILGDCMDRLPGCVGLRAYYKGPRMAGPALTVQTAPGDNLAIHQALEVVRPGEVIVVDAGGVTDRALVGEIMKLLAQKRQAAGFVIDGAIRDVEAYMDDDFPCFARAVIHRGPYKNGPGRTGVPINLGGQVISPGDIVVGDADGVLAFPSAQLEPLLASARLQIEKEESIIQSIQDGTYNGDYAKPALLRKSGEGFTS